MIIRFVHSVCIKSLTHTHAGHAHSTFRVSHYYYFNILIIHFSLRRRSAMAKPSPLYSPGPVVGLWCSVYCDHIRLTECALCVRKCTHSFRWCVCSPRFTFFVVVVVVVVCFCSISFSLLSPVQIIISPFLWLLRSTITTHIFHLRCFIASTAAFFSSFRSRFSYSSCVISMDLCSDSQCIDEYSAPHILLLHIMIHVVRDEDPDHCLSPGLKCTHLFVIIAIIKELKNILRTLNRRKRWNGKSMECGCVWVMGMVYEWLDYYFHFYASAVYLFLFVCVRVLAHLILCCIRNVFIQMNSICVCVCVRRSWTQKKNKEEIINRASERAVKSTKRMK